MCTACGIEEFSFLLKKQNGAVGGSYVEPKCYFISLIKSSKKCIYLFIYFKCSKQRLEVVARQKKKATLAK